MSNCARCGHGVCTASEKIAINKIWHKCCFSCCSCGRQLNVNSAKVHCGEVFCDWCYRDLAARNCWQPCRVNSTPSFLPFICYPKTTRRCDSGETLRCVATKDTHSCSCIPVCCQQRKICPPRNSGQCEEICQRPRSPKPCDYPPRGRSPANRSKCCSPANRCKCCECFPKKACVVPKCSPSPCPPKCPPPQFCCEKKNFYAQGGCCGAPKCSPKNCGGVKKMLYFEPNKCCAPTSRSYSCKCNCSGCERCRRCGEKVFAAEKIITSSGSYHLGCFTCFCCCKSLCIKTMYEACREIYCKQCYNTYFGLNGYGY